MIIFNQAIKRILKNKVRLIVLLIMPILFIVMFALQDERSLTIGIVDKDQTVLSQKLRVSLEEMYKVKVMPLKEKEVYDKAVSYQTDYTIIIEPGFEEKLAVGGNPEIKEFYLSEKEKLYYARSTIESFISSMRTLAAGVSFKKVEFDKVLKAYEHSELSVRNESAESKKIPRTRQAMGFLIQFMIYMSVVTAGLIIEDKSSGIFYRTFYAPVTLKRYIVENITAFLIIGIIQVTLIMALVRVAFGIELGANPINLYLLFIVFSLVCVSLGVWIVSLFKKPMGAYILILFVTTPLVMLGGCYWPQSFMPEVFQNIARFIPTSWAMNGVDKILYEGKDLLGIYLEILILLVFSGIFLAAGLLKKVDISK